MGILRRNTEANSHITLRVNPIVFFLSLRREEKRTIFVCGVQRGYHHARTRQGRFAPPPAVALKGNP